MKITSCIIDYSLGKHSHAVRKTLLQIRALFDKRTQQGSIRIREGRTIRDTVVWGCRDGRTWEAGGEGGQKPMRYSSLDFARVCVRQTYLLNGTLME